MASRCTATSFHSISFSSCLGHHKWQELVAAFRCGPAGFLPDGADLSSSLFSHCGHSQVGRRSRLFEYAPTRLAVAGALAPAPAVCDRFRGLMIASHRAELIRSLNSGDDQVLSAIVNNPPGSCGGES
jgi:hypothetical protein